MQKIKEKTTRTMEMWKKKHRFNTKLHPIKLYSFNTFASQTISVWDFIFFFIHISIIVIVVVISFYAIEAKRKKCLKCTVNGVDILVEAVVCVIHCTWLKLIYISHFNLPHLTYTITLYQNNMPYRNFLDELVFIQRV